MCRSGVPVEAGEVKQKSYNILYIVPIAKSIIILKNMK